MTSAAKPASGPTAEQKRTIALAATATILVVVFAVLHFARSGAIGPVETVVAERGAGSHDPTSTPPPGIGDDEKSWQRHYKAILDADPFRERTFKPRVPGGKTKPDTEPANVSSSGSSSAGMLSLVVTGIVRQGENNYAILESRGTGKGAFLKVGDKVGTQSVASISTDTLSLIPQAAAAISSSSGTAPGASGTAAIASGTAPVASGTSGTAPVASTTSPKAPTAPAVATVNVRIGSTLDVKPGDLVLEMLGSATVGASGTIIPKLSEERKLSVLEELKRKRQASLGSGG